MLVIKPHRDFKKDMERDRQSGQFDKADFEMLLKVIDTLSDAVVLDQKYKDHILKGNWQGYRECHIKPDWLLVYRINEAEGTLNLARLGSHN